MSRQAEQLRVPRTVAIRFPEGDTEFWLTDQVFSAGQTIPSKGRDWFVHEVLEPLSDNHSTVVVRPSSMTRRSPLSAGH